MKFRSSAALALACTGVSAVELAVENTTSIKEAASRIAKGLYIYHNADATSGQFNQPEPWFWWLSGKGWNGLVDYQVYTEDTTYQDDILFALGKNVGPNFDFVPTEQTNWEANDDQAYWVYNALTALEYDFPALPCPEGTNETETECANSWLNVATNAFNLFAERWNHDSTTCNGGLKWQYNPQAAGYTYKNAVTNGGFFQIAARLARYTGNQTYADWAVKIWDWSRGVGLVSPDYHVFDGTPDDNAENCTGLNHDEWSYNIATYMHGAAHMYAFTNNTNATAEASQDWEAHVQGFVKTAGEKFFSPASTGVMFEQKCEQPDMLCSTDQTSFKASLSRWMGKTAVLVPSVRESIMNMLTTSARAAAASCTGNGNSTCGQRWTTGDFDGQSDFGVELSALEVVQSLLVVTAPELKVADAPSDIVRSVRGASS